MLIERGQVKKISISVSADELFIWKTQQQQNGMAAKIIYTHHKIYI